MFAPLSRYAQFRGRARRREFWMFALLQLLIAFAVGIPADLAGHTIYFPDFDPRSALAAEGPVAALRWLVWAASMALILPNLAVASRRLHDRNLSALWLLTPLAVLFAIGSVAIAGWEGLALGLAFGFWLVCLVLVVVLMRDGTAGPNRFGEDPKGRGIVEIFA